VVYVIHSHTDTLIAVTILRPCWSLNGGEVALCDGKPSEIIYSRLKNAVIP